MKSNKQIYDENIARIDLILNKGGNPNHGSDGRFVSGMSKSSNKSISDKELTEITKSVWRDTQGPNLRTKFPEQMLLEKIYAKQGYNKKPKLISSEEFAAEKNGVKVYRGINDKDLRNNYTKQFMEGSKHYPGVGVFGSGTYSANIQSEAEAYARRYAEGPGINGQVVSIIIPKNAKVINYNEARIKAKDFGNKLYEKNKSIKVTDINDVGFANWNSGMNKDPGIWAASHGYDAIVVDAGKITTKAARKDYIILNRGILKIDKNVKTI